MLYCVVCCSGPGVLGCCVVLCVVVQQVYTEVPVIPWGQRQTGTYILLDKHRSMHTCGQTGVELDRV